MMKSVTESLSRRYNRSFPGCWGLLVIASIFVGSLLQFESLYAHESTWHNFRHTVSRFSPGLSEPCQAPPDQQATVTLELVDAEDGRARSGLVRISGVDCTVDLEGQLLNRGTGLPENHPARNWFVLPGTAKLELPKRSLRLEAFSGLETKLIEKPIDLSRGNPISIRLELEQIWDRNESASFSGNTHLHLRNLSKAGAERYLREISAADDLDLLFPSYLERAGDDQDYTTNAFSLRDMARLRTSTTLFAYGEEYRHNFGAGGEGYGHLLFLNLKKLVLPASIGPGITKAGDDSTPLRPGIVESRKQDATIVWCHNAFGLERFPSWVAGLLDAQNIFDGGSRGSYEDTFYRYLNVGLKTPFSTGTDWFMYDLSRVYVNVQDGFSVENWLKDLSLGRSFITNGPLLELNVSTAEPGETLRLDNPAPVPIRARCIGRQDFGKLELIHDGDVIDRIDSTEQGGSYQAELTCSVELESSGWFAVRVSGDSKNELGQVLFGHSSPAYVQITGTSVFRESAAERLKTELDLAMDTIRQSASFSDQPALEAILALYKNARRWLSERMSIFARNSQNRVTEHSD